MKVSKGGGGEREVKGDVRVEQGIPASDSRGASVKENRMPEVGWPAGGGRPGPQGQPWRDERCHR
eukprot:scaffold192738_cov37-Tisochrysis_lutea.AAC.2